MFKKDKKHIDDEFVVDQSIEKEVNSDLDDSVIAEEAAQESLKKLREKIRTLETEKQEYLTGWQRAKADLINARKRDEEERKDFIKYANERLIDGLIPVLDSFEMAMGNKESWEKADKNWRMGVEYIYSQLKKTLADAGLIEIDPIGKKFEAARDEASSYEPVHDLSMDHVVIRTIQKGYELHGRQMRPPKVVVGEYKE